MAKKVILQEELPIVMEKPLLRVPPQKNTLMIKGKYCLLSTKGYVLKTYINLDYKGACEAAKQLAIAGNCFVSVHKQ